MTEQTVKSMLTIKKQAFIADGEPTFNATALLLAKQAADREFDRYFPKIYPYITRIEACILKEMHIPEGYQVYLMRVYVEAPLEVVQRLHREAGVQVEIPRDQIRYRPEEVK